MRAHGWVRDLPADSHLYKKTGNAFDDNFIFATPGYNVRPLEMSGAIGSVQLTKWNSIMETRLANKEHFLSLFANKSWCRVQKEIGTSSWFTFGIVLDGELKGRRAEVIDALSKAGIQNRPLASRNFLKQPVMRDLDFIVSGQWVTPNKILLASEQMTAADDIHNNGFFVGNGSENIKESIDKLYEVIHSFVK